MQRAVAAAGFPTPIVRAAGSPDDGLGVAFMVMDRAPGGPALSGLDGAVPGRRAATATRDPGSAGHVDGAATCARPRPGAR